MQFIFYFWFSLVDCATIMSSTFRCLPGESNVDQSTCIKSTCFVDHQGYSMKHTRGEISWFYMYNKKLVNSEYPPPQKKNRKKPKQTNKKKSLDCKNKLLIYPWHILSVFGNLCGYCIVSKYVAIEMLSINNLNTDYVT